MTELVVPADVAGERADVTLARLGRIPRAAAREALRSGAILLGGASVRPAQRVSAGEVFTGRLPEPDTEEPAPEDIPVEVRYEDDRVVVVSKPAGLVTHPGSGHPSGTLVNALLARHGTLGGTDPLRPGIVHRLDKDTSGLLLVALDDAAHSSLTQALKERVVLRTYAALVRGTIPEDRGTIEAPLGRHPHHRRKMAVVAGGRSAVTHYEVVERGDKVTLLSVGLETGRTHQIRVHLSHLKHPVLGDPLYGGRSELAASLGLQRPFLHASRLVFPHPDDGRPVEVTDPLPEDLKAALEAAGLTPEDTG